MAGPNRGNALQFYSLTVSAGDFPASDGRTEGAITPTDRQSARARGTDLRTREYGATLAGHFTYRHDYRRAVQYLHAAAENGSGGVPFRKRMRTLLKV